MSQGDKPSNFTLNREVLNNITVSITQGHLLRGVLHVFHVIMEKNMTTVKCFNIYFSGQNRTKVSIIYTDELHDCPTLKTHFSFHATFLAHTASHGSTWPKYSSKLHQMDTGGILNYNYSLHHLV